MKLSSVIDKIKFWIFKSRNLKLNIKLLIGALIILSPIIYVAYLHIYPIVMGSFIVKEKDDRRIISFGEPADLSIVEQQLRLLDSLRLPIPEEYLQEIEDVVKSSYSHLNYQLFYFSQPPEEIYVVEYNMDIAIINVYYCQEWWINKKTISNSEKQRIKRRFEEEILSKVKPTVGEILKGGG